MNSKINYSPSQNAKGYRPDYFRARIDRSILEHFRQPKPEPDPEQRQSWGQTQITPSRSVRACRFGR